MGDEKYNIKVIDTLRKRKRSERNGTRSEDCDRLIIRVLRYKNNGTQ